MTKEEEPGVPGWVRARAAATEARRRDLERSMAAAGFEPLPGGEMGDLPEHEGWCAISVPLLGDGAVVGRKQNHVPQYVELLGRAGQRFYVRMDEVSREHQQALERAYETQRARDLSVAGKPAMQREEAETWLYDLLSLHDRYLEARREQVPFEDPSKLRELRHAWQAAKEKAVRQLVRLGSGQPWKEVP